MLACVVLISFNRPTAQDGFAASGRNLKAPKELEYLDRFVGAWDVRTIGQDESVAPKARVDGAYILDGTMLQVDWRGLDPAGNVTSRGTSLRTWDPRAKLYSMKWAVSLSKNFTLIEAHVDDEGNMVSTGKGEGLGGAFIERYRFFDFEDDAFKFEMDRSRDDGKTWKRFGYNQYTRR